MARIFERKEGQSIYSASTQTRMELSRNYHMQYLLCKLEVTHTNGAAPSFKDEEIYSLINHLEIVANGNNTLKSIPSRKLYINNVIGTTQKGINSVFTTASQQGTSTVWFAIPFSLFNTIRPHDTILNTAVFTTFDLLINWGSSASIGSDITVDAAKLDVWSSSLVGYKRDAGETIKFFLENNLSEDITATTSNKEIKMPVNAIYKGFSIAATVDGVRNANVIKGIKIKSGTTVIIDLDADALKAKNIFEFRPENQNLLDAIYVIDFAIRGRLTDCLNTINDFNTLEIVLDVEKQTGDNKVHIMSDIIEQTSTVEK